MGLRFRRLEDGREADRFGCPGNGVWKRPEHTHLRSGKREARDAAGLGRTARAAVVGRRKIHRRAESEEEASIFVRLQIRDLVGTGGGKLSLGAAMVARGRRAVLPGHG